MVRFFVFMLLLAAILSGCGGGGDSVSGEPQDGSIQVRNEIQYATKVSYIYDNQPFSYTVEPGETKEISRLIRGGTKLVLKLEVGFSDTTAHAEAEVTMDGNITIRITGAQYHGRVQYEVVGSVS